MLDKKNIVKTNTPGLVKDRKSGAILADNDNEYQMIVARRKAKAEAEKTSDEMKRLRRDLDMALDEIKKLKEKVGL